MSRLAFPYAVSASGRSAAVGYGSDAHVRQMLELLVLTLIGERVMRPELGSPVPQMLFRAGEGAVATALSATLHATISQWLGHLVEVHELTVEFIDAEAALEVQIEYVVLATTLDDRLWIRTSVA